MEKYAVWDIVDAPQDRSVVKNRWVFTIKKDAVGTLRYKARLVAKGYSQVQGIDYKETYSPVVKIDSLKILFTLAVKKKILHSTSGREHCLLEWIIRGGNLHGYPRRTQSIR